MGDGSDVECAALRLLATELRAVIGNRSSVYCRARTVGIAAVRGGKSEQWPGLSVTGKVARKVSLQGT
jgi:hypothetical protein